MGDFGISIGGVSAITYVAAIGADFWMTLLTGDPDLDLETGNSGDAVKDFAMEGTSPTRYEDWGLNFYSRTQRIYNSTPIVFPTLVGASGEQTARYVAWLNNGFYSEAQEPTGDWSNSYLWACTPLARELTFSNGSTPEIPAGMATIDFIGEEQ